MSAKSTGRFAQRQGGPAPEKPPAEHPDGGLTAAQIIEVLRSRGVSLTEATFRKWVQLGLLPRSRRVGRKGKHQGSLGLYPAATVERIAAVKQLMAENLTIEEIQRAYRFKDDMAVVAGGLEELFDSFGKAVVGPEFDGASRREVTRLLGETRREAGELVRRIEGLERRIVTPLLRAARARVFGSGVGGGAGELL